MFLSQCALKGRVRIATLKAMSDVLPDVFAVQYAGNDRWLAVAPNEARTLTRTFARREIRHADDEHGRGGLVREPVRRAGGAGRSAGLSSARYTPKLAAPYFAIFET
jgi:hypothetical protein